MEEAKRIKTSVIIPVYNTGQYLGGCIDSVFHQTQKEIEVIAVNDGSTDNSLEVLLHLQEKYPELIIITQENHGQGYARNVGMERAKGEYIFFLDSDDYILQDTFESCYEYASEKELDIVFFDAFTFEDSIEKHPIVPNNCDRHGIIEEREEIFSGVYFLEKYYQKSYVPADCLLYYSASFIKKNNIWFLTDVYFEDNELYCKVMTLAERVMYIPRMFYQYRCRKDSTTGSYFDLRRAKDHIEVLRAMADLKTLAGGKSWHVVRQICLDLLRYVASMCKHNSLYYEEGSQLPDQMIDTWVKICGNTIENAESLEDINNICRLCVFFPDSDLNERKKLINIRKKQLLIHTFKRLLLNRKESRVAIYGCGRYTDRVLDFYEKWVGVIEADLIFLDSYATNTSIKYKNYTVYPVSEIGGKKIDYILISSPRYENEMSDMIRKLYGNQFKMVMLYGGLHIDI